MGIELFDDFSHVPAMVVTEDEGPPKNHRACVLPGGGFMAADLGPIDENTILPGCCPVHDGGLRG